MRTKTLLVACAALALSLATSQAQVYSANVVGYINVTVPGTNGFAEVANHLITGTDANQTNNSIDAVYANGLISDSKAPNTGSNSVYLAWTGGGFVKYYYYNAADALTAGNNLDINDTTAGWYNAVGDHAGLTVKQGISAFLYDPTTSPMTVTTVGTVLQGTGVSVLTISNGFNFLSLPVPVQTNADVAAYGLPANITSDNKAPNSGTNDVILAWTGNGYVKYYYYNAADALIAGNNLDINDTTAGFYNAVGDHMPSSAYPSPGKGFVLQHSGGTIPWTITFNVQ